MGRMTRSTGVAAAMLATAMLVPAAPARADIISGTYHVSVTNPGPLSPFVVDFSATFDNTQTYPAGSSFVTLLNNPYAPLSLSPSGALTGEYFAPADWLVVRSGIIAGFLQDFREFVLRIDHASTNPVFTFLTYSTNDACPPDSCDPPIVVYDYGVREATGTVTFTPAPEPMSLALLATGLAGLGLTARRRHPATPG